MTPAPRVLSVTELRLRWHRPDGAPLSREGVHNVARTPGFPEGTKSGGRWVWATGDIEAWEAAQRAAGRPLPGERPGGPQPTAER
jgi:hypothetical protein